MTREEARVLVSPDYTQRVVEPLLQRHIEPNITTYWHEATGHTRGNRTHGSHESQVASLGVAYIGRLSQPVCLDCVLALITSEL